MTRHRPLFSGERLTLMDWQMADLERMLGRHADTFNLYDWINDLDASLAQAGDVVPPHHQQHRWLQELLYAEVQRRGIAVATAPAKAWSLSECPHLPKCGSAWRCHQLTQLAEFKRRA